MVSLDVKNKPGNFSGIFQLTQNISENETAIDILTFCSQYKMIETSVTVDLQAIDLRVRIMPKTHIWIRAYTHTKASKQTKARFFGNSVDVACAYSESVSSQNLSPKWVCAISADATIRS